MNGVAEAARDRETTAYSPAVPVQPRLGARDVQALQAAGVLLIMLGDIAALLMAAGLALALRLYLLPYVWPSLARELPPQFARHMAWVLLVAVAFLVYEKLYVRRQSFWRETYVVFKALTLTALISFAAVGLAKLSSEISRSVVVLWYLFAIVTVPAARHFIKPALARAGLWREPVLVLGAGKTGELVARALTRSPYMGLCIAGFLDDDPVKQARGITAGGRHYRVAGGFADAPDIIRSHGIRNVIIAAPGMSGSEQVELVNRLQPLVRTVSVVPDLFGIPVASGEVTYFFDEGVLAYRHRNNLAYPANRLVKRAFDIVVGSVGLVLASPLIIAIALAVKLTSPGPVIFSHRRIGMGGKEFMCHKFRTMVANAEDVLRELLEKNPTLRAEWEKDFKLKDDPRITGVGKILRKTSLDELPQIFNVIKGEMSLVGPRPIVKAELDKFGNYASDYLLVRPGITGLWQVSGRNDIDYHERVQLESRYIRNWSLWLDITLLFRTIPAVLKRDGAY